MSAPTLLDLATVVTGRPVDMDRVQITDKKAFEPIGNLFLEAASRDIAAGREPVPPELTGYAQHDGRLEVRVSLEDGGTRIVEVPAGMWVELDAETFARLEADLDGPLESAPPQQLTEDLATLMLNNAEAMRSRSAQATSISRLVIFDRSPQALHTAKDVSANYPALADEFETWLGSEAPYLVLFVNALTTEMAVAEIAKIDDLLGPGLPYFAEAFGDALPNAALTASWFEPSIATRLYARWRELGGWVPALG